MVFDGRGRCAAAPTSAYSFTVANLRIDNGVVTISLSTMEKVEAIRSDVTFPRSAITGIREADDGLGEVHGMRMPGTEPSMGECQAGFWILCQGWPVDASGQSGRLCACRGFRPGRVAAVAGMLAAVLALTGCAAGINVSTTDAKIGSVSGVTGATVQIEHPAAPWNTETIVRLFMVDDSAPAVAPAVRHRAAAIRDEPIARHAMVVVAHPGPASDWHGKDLVDVAAGRTAP